MNERMCERIAVLVSAYRDGELTPAERKQVEAHLYNCPACARRLASYRELHGALRGHLATAPATSGGWERKATGREGNSGRGMLRPVAVWAVAAALVLVAAGGLYANTQFGQRPTLLVPTRAPGSTVAAPTMAPGAQPVPGWLVTERPVVTNAGVSLALLRVEVNEPHFVVLFMALAGPAEWEGFDLTPADLKVVDDAGREYPATFSRLESVRGVTLGAVSLPGPDAATAVLSLRITGVAAEQPATGEKKSLAGLWEMQALRRNSLATVYPDRHETLLGPECFQANGVALGSAYYASCDGAGGPSEAGVSVPTAAPMPPVIVTPAPTRLPAPTAIPPAVLPPTEAPPATALPVPPTPAPSTAPGASPLATATPAWWGWGDFTDWRNGLFGLSLSLSAPQPHLVHVLIDQSTGGVRAVSQAEFEAARQRAAAQDLPQAPAGPPVAQPSAPSGATATPAPMPAPMPTAMPTAVPGSDGAPPR
ncbi:MAG: zf-HC2 domain-containing protein [Dehalococcoidales bacterium]|nr:zf-HC2 domain-containing protein [Dehalococcoidales bacterium]